VTPLLVAALLVLCNAFFVAAEFSLIATRRRRCLTSSPAAGSVRT